MYITIYSTTTCSFCHALMEWLDKQNIAYTSKVTDSDEQAMADFMAVNDGVFSVPLSVVKDKDDQEIKILGFDKNKFRQVLNLK